MDTLRTFVPLASRNAGESILTKQEPQTWIVTGPRGVGKTTFCQKLTHRFKSSGIALGGILSSARFEEDVKTGIFLEDLQTGEINLLGSSTPQVDYFLKVGCWYFNEDVLHWGNKCLRAAAGCEMVVFDECGLLEFNYGGGFMSGVDLFDRRDFRMGVVVVRPSLVTVAQKRWPGAVVIDLERLH